MTVVSPDELADDVYDEMYRVLDAMDSAQPTARLLSGLAKLAVLRTLGCPCFMDIRDPECRALLKPEGCAIHGDI